MKFVLGYAVNPESTVCQALLRIATSSVRLDILVDSCGLRMQLAVNLSQN